MKTMTTTAGTFRIIARYRDGSALYVSRSRKQDKAFTPLKGQSARFTEAEARDHVERWHAVQALGVYHQDVAYYDAVRAS